MQRKEYFCFTFCVILTQMRVAVVATDLEKMYKCSDASGAPSVLRDGGKTRVTFYSP